MKPCPVCRRKGGALFRQLDEDWTRETVACAGCRTELAVIQARSGSWAHCFVGGWNEAVEAYEERRAFRPCYVCSVELGCYVEHQGPPCLHGESVFATTSEEYEAARRYFSDC